MDLAQAKNLFESAKQGNPQAREQIFLSYFQPVFRYIFIRTRKRQDAEDLAQTVFLKFYQSLHNFSFQKEPLAYLFTIARNTLIDHLRKHRFEPIELAEQLNAPEPLSEHAQFDLTEFLNELDERQKDCLILRFINGYRAEEIGKILNLSPNNVRQIQSRALKQLRQKHDTKQ